MASDPAGVAGTEQAQQEGETAEEAVGQQEAETAEQEDAMAAAFAAPDPQVGQAGPFSPRPLAARGASISGAKDSGAGTAEAAKGANLLALKLETILALYGDKSAKSGATCNKLAPWTGKRSWATEVMARCTWAGRVYLDETSARAPLPSRCCGREG